MNKSIDITLEGTTSELTALFSYTKAEQDTGLTSLETYISHAVNQTLVRDHYYGAWAEVLQDNEKYVLKMYSPHHDLSLYAQLIPAWIEAGKIALAIYQANLDAITKAGKGQMQYLLPFGLCMAKTKSVQLLHFPPLETFVYQDYLYSPTNRRWENLLGYNKVTGINYAELESIVDCVPIAAPGDDGPGIAPFNNTFTPYVKKMLQARLTPTGNTTQPVVAYGEPVRAWLQQAFSDQITGTLETLSLIDLKLMDSDVTTPVLCANHPSKYLYFTDDPYTQEKEDIMTQDLISAGWQAQMAYHPDSSAQKALQDLKDHWTNNARVREIMIQEDEAYGYKI